MRGRRQYLWGFAILVFSTSPGQGAPAKRAKPTKPANPIATCTQHLEAMGRALAAYQRDHRSLPANLSDLYPRYVKDVKLLHCPADHTPGEPGHIGAKPDPNMPISYFYEMSLEKDPAGVLLGPEPQGAYKTWREFKTAQRRYFGDRVPVVRCWHHVPSVDSPTAYSRTSYVLNLTPSGQVYRSIPGWERDPATIMTVLTLMERDLKAGSGQFRRVWLPDATARYVTALQKVTPETSLRLRSVADALAAAGQKDPALAESGTLMLAGALYRSAGYTTKAINVLEKAVQAPGDRRISAPLLAEIYHRVGKDAESVRFLHELQAKEPEDVLFMKLLGHAYEADGQPEKADEWLAKVDQWLVGQRAPDFTLKDARGKEVRLSEKRGKVVVLVFWKPSDMASAWLTMFLEELNQQYRSRGVAIYCLHDEPTHADAKEIARRVFTFPLLLDAAPVFRQYGVLQVPTTYVIDTAGQVALRRVGFDMERAEDLTETIKRVLPLEAASRPTEPGSGPRLVASE
jgi:peroxiredoxin